MSAAEEGTEPGSDDPMEELLLECQFFGVEKVDLAELKKLPCSPQELLRLRVERLLLLKKIEVMEEHFLEEELERVKNEFEAFKKFVASKDESPPGLGVGKPEEQVTKEGEGVGGEPGGSVVNAAENGDVQGAAVLVRLEGHDQSVAPMDSSIVDAGPAGDSCPLVEVVRADAGDNRSSTEAGLPTGSMEVEPTNIEGHSNITPPTTPQEGATSGAVSGTLDKNNDCPGSSMADRKRPLRKSIKRRCFCCPSSQDHGSDGEHSADKQGNHHVQEKVPPETVERPAAPPSPEESDFPSDSDDSQGADGETSSEGEDNVKWDAAMSSFSFSERSFAEDNNSADTSVASVKVELESQSQVASEAGMDHMMGTIDFPASSNVPPVVPIPSTSAASRTHGIAQRPSRHRVKPARLRPEPDEQSPSENRQQRRDPKEITKRKKPGVTGKRRKVRKTSSGVQFSCPKCPRKFARGDNVTRHLREVHDGYKRPREYRRHRIAARKPKTTASTSRKTLSGQGPSMSSAGTSTGSKTRPSSVSQKNKMRTTQDVPRSSPLVPCHLCNKVLSSRKTLMKHIKFLHSGVVMRPFRCSECPATFAVRGRMVRHKRTVHEGRRHYCRYCPKSYGSSYRLRIHENQHVRGTGELSRAACPYCPKHYSDEEGLKGHILRSHPEEQSDSE